MFNWESYITPVILSYVKKYVKNFKPEQSQVSLWGGDASFQNLDLRLEVLEEQLNLPFNFVSGHIHELLIHVPWVKITSEPIVVTINTIECILKLKDGNSTEPNKYVPPRKDETDQGEAPPGYIKSIITKVVNNITIHCHNLILKYVEEDIVLSVNVRFLSMQTVDDKWKPAFTDVNTYEVVLRKIITIQDLTLCLDKMDASGKIEVYQDPVLYRCSVNIRLIINYHSNTAKRASITRLDLHCLKMEFSITEQQIPMLLRLATLIMALQTKQFSINREKPSTSAEEREDVVQDDEAPLPETVSEVISWVGWAWNMASSLLPVDWENEWSSEQQTAYSGHTIHLGVYVDDTILTFKTVESVKEQLFYKSRKLRYKSFLSLRLNGVLVDALLQGIAMTSFQIGLGSISLYPRGACSCGHLEVIDGVQPPLYLMSGRWNTNYLKDSLFDNQAVENMGKKRDYKQGVDYHLATVSVEKLMERCPAFVMDYVHYIELPDDITPEKLIEFGSNFEYSNFHEQRVIRYLIGDLTIRLCSGIFHRIDTIKRAAANYDCNLYITLKPDPTADELPPVTLEEFEALRENVSMTEVRMIVTKVCLQFQLADHSITGLPRQRKIAENWAVPLVPSFTNDPYVSIGCDKVTANILQPMYPFRLAACASKQTKQLPDMFNQCHKKITIQIDGIKSQLYLSKHCHVSIVMPCSAKSSIKILLYPQYWKSLDLVCETYSFLIDSVTITGTKAKLMVATSILASIINPNDTTNPLICSSLFNDAYEEKSSVYLELLLENVHYKILLSPVTSSNKININSIKMFALNDSQQTFILSGPETDIYSDTENKPLLRAVIQFPKDTTKQIDPPLISFQIAEIRGSLDPLLLEWLQYRVTYYKLGTLYTTHQENQSSAEAASSDTSTRKKTFPSLYESVHSSSDKEKKKSITMTEKSKTLQNDEFQKKNTSKVDHEFEKPGILVRLAELYPWWCGLVLSGCIGHIVIYIPSITMNGIGANGIEEAKSRALQADQSLQILIVKLPSLLVHSSNINLELIAPYLKVLPVKLPKSMWTYQVQSFPWTINLFEFHCYILQQKTQTNFIKKVSMNATVALTTKSTSSQGNTQTALSLCVHIDNSPIIISISEEQVAFMSCVASKILNCLQIASEFGESNIFVPQVTNEAQMILPVIPRTPSTPTQIICPEDTTTNSTVSTSKDDLISEKDGLVLTSWVQWTITKIAIKLYIMQKEIKSSLKLMLEMEDIITSLDLQPVYLKLKSKITTATVFHYVRAPHVQSWDVGEYAGIILCGREDNVEKGDDSGFLSFTLTRAQSGNVHTRWGAHKRPKSQKRDLITNALLSTNGYISEIDIKIQMVDLILPLTIITKYIDLVEPLLHLKKSAETVEKNTQEGIITSMLASITKINNESLPLVHLEFKGLRLMIPASTYIKYKLQHDLLILQLDGIRITPHAENPICRTPLRLDIYQLAAQANILNVPGSAVEDRQYQINVKGICAYSTTWKNYQVSINKRMSQSYLYTMNENPALEWNKLGNKSNLEPHFSTFPVLTKFDLCLIIAPTIKFKPDTIVCGSAVEVNCVTDIDITVNIDQIKLMSVLSNEWQHLISQKLQEKDVVKTSNNTAEKSPVILNIKQVTWIKQMCVEQEIDVTKDSGVDFEMSSVNSTITRKPVFQETIFSPCEFLINCGKITFILYEMQKISGNSEYQININEANEDDNENVKQSLLYIMINQPNIYLWQQYLSQKMQVSCFDVTIALGNKENQDLSSVLTENNFNNYILETKYGDPHPDTGIPPSFVTIKYEKIPGKNTHFCIDMGRPTKLHFSLSRLNKISNIKEKIASCIVHEEITKVLEKSHNEDDATLHHAPKSKKVCLPDLNLNTKQIVLSFQTDCGSEIMISSAALDGNTSTLLRPDRIFANISVDSFIVSALLNGSMKVLLNPWCYSITICFLWEAWQNVESIPQIQVQADSDSIYIDFGPEQLKIIDAVLQDCWLLLNKLKYSSTNGNDHEKQIVLSTEQHYKDDLKAGAFQYIDGNAEELPFPYQVIFFAYPQQAMAWRYPQPRTLTKIHVSPVPFETLDYEGKYIDKIPCAIEYWSDSHMAYQHYINFYLSETDSYRLDLPEKAPSRAVACVWRVILLTSNNQAISKNVISARALAACLRIDSYFNSSIIPNVQAALNIGVIHISLYNHINPCTYNTLLPPLQNFSVKGTIPETQCFMSLEHKGAILVLNRWVDGSMLIDINGTLGAYVLDYSYLTMQEILDPLEGKFQISLSNKIDISVICKLFSLKLAPTITHTLTVSTYLWSAFLNAENTIIILTRYVIANDCNISIRFGQSGTDDNVLLESRQCNFYSWRCVGNNMIRISTEANAWIWSRPFSVNKDGIQIVEFSNASTNTSIFVSVTSISATQKLITFYGQLIISNQLIDNFEMKLVKYEAGTNNKVTVSNDVYMIASKSQPPSIVLESNRRMAMRIRFANVPNLSWTGDIPLQLNAKLGQPWLVKVPLQERGQFLSIWVRIVTQIIQEKVKMLAVLSPLYMIRSYLPVPVKVQMETPSLKMSLSTMVNGCGECQQLYCPGTFEHFHQLTFQLESGICASNPYVPLSYSSVDQRKFFRRPEVEDIEVILKELDSQKDEVQWPFQGDDVEEWIPAEQPQTHVQVKYQDAGLVSSTLLLELQPWCFILNSLGCYVSLISENIELCQIPHHGIVTPPKLEGTFHIGVGIGDMYYTSQPLQLAKPDWSQSFYMPRIGGLIPVEGNIKTTIDCGPTVTIMNINSNMHEDMRVIRITSSYVISNLMFQEICVTTLAVNDAAVDMRLPENLSSYGFNLSPTEDQKEATPIIQWHLLNNDDNIETLVLYISLSLGHKWSCPVRVDQSISRKCIAIPNGSVTVPVVVTTLDDKGTTYIMIHVDDHPQLMVKNVCSFKILLGQANENGDNVIPDTSHFSWMCEVESGTACHYSLPSVGNRLPDAPINNICNVLLLSTLVDNSNGRSSTQQEQLQWSRGINLSVLSHTSMDHFVRLPSYGDVKLIIQLRCYTIHISIVPISQIEVSARDIRSRLLQKESNNPKDVETVYNKSLLTPTESEKTLINVQSSSSSTSMTSFFSAQDDDSVTTDSSISSEFKLIPKGKYFKIDEDSNKLKSDGERHITNCREGSAIVYFHGITIIIMHDINESAQRIEVASLSVTDLIISLNARYTFLNLCICIKDLQLDNQMFDQGGFDFPVILINQSPLLTRKTIFYTNNYLINNMTQIKADSLIGVDCIFETNGQTWAMKDFHIKIAPISAYIEDTYISQLLDYTNSMLSPRFIMPLNSTKKKRSMLLLSTIHIPDYVMIDAKILSKPLRLQNFTIEPVSILLSVHTSVRLYIALDHSPLYFGTFERKILLTTPYRLGNALTMHYLSGAIFGAGWIVGSLEILGSPGGLAQALGSGLRDFVSLPFQGLLQGPWSFIIGITHGSASLMKHVTAGTVNSVTKLASSVARNLDRLTLDEEHLQRQEEARRLRPQGMAQGLYQGLTGFGMSLLAAVAGLAHHPLQQVWSGEATTKSLVAGVGLGLVGVVTKPLSGAAELVALTGQGLLQGAGWNSLPSPRQRPVVQYSTGSTNSSIRYMWRLLPLLENSHDSILHVTNADYVIQQGSNHAVTLVLTRQALLLVNVAEDSIEKIFSLKELSSIDHPSESTMLCLYCPPAKAQPSKSLSPAEHEMDLEMRARVAEYVRTSSTGLASVSTNSDGQSETLETVTPHLEHTLTFYVTPDSRNYLLSLFNIAKRQNLGNGFVVL